MEALGYTVEAVADGGEALDALLRTEFDLATFDVMMPRMSGLELVRQVRAVDPEHTLAIILLSAFASPEDIRRGIEAGADVYLTKPMTTAQLRAEISSLVPGQS